MGAGEYCDSTCIAEYKPVFAYREAEDDYG